MSDKRDAFTKWWDKEWGNYRGSGNHKLYARHGWEARDALMKEMAEALEAMLSALNNEASAAMAAEVASSNFDNPEPYIANYEKAVIASSEASTKAHAALDKYKEQL